MTDVADQVTSEPLTRCAHPASAMSLYPGDDARIADFEFLSALSLVRPVGSVPDRLGPDADYALGADFVCRWRDEGGTWRRIRVPAGLITDLTSVPPLFRTLVGRVGPWLEAAIVHDYLYIAWTHIEGRGVRAADRRFADRIMLAAMRANRVRGWRALLIFAAVRAFGGRGYRNPPECPYVDPCDLKGEIYSGTSSTPIPPHG